MSPSGVAQLWNEMRFSVVSGSGWHSAAKALAQNGCWAVCEWRGWLWWLRAVGEHWAGAHSFIHPFMALQWAAIVVGVSSTVRYLISKTAIKLCVRENIWTLNVGNAVNLSLTKTKQSACCAANMCIFFFLFRISATHTHVCRHKWADSHSHETYKLAQCSSTQLRNPAKRQPGNSLRQKLN